MSQLVDEREDRSHFSVASIDEHERHHLVRDSKASKLFLRDRAAGVGPYEASLKDKHALRFRFCTKGGKVSGGVRALTPVIITNAKLASHVRRNVVSIAARIIGEPSNKRKLRGSSLKKVLNKPVLLRQDIFKSLVEVATQRFRVLNLAQIGNCGAGNRRRFRKEEITERNPGLLR